LKLYLEIIVIIDDTVKRGSKVMDLNTICNKIRQAVINNRINEVSELLNANIELLNIERAFGTWLHMAADSGHLEVVKLLVDLGIDIEIKAGFNKGNALNEAASEGHLEVVKYLIECKSKLDGESESVLTSPLCMAIYHGDKEIVELLLASGADPKFLYKVEGGEMVDAYLYAIGHNEMEIAERLFPFHKDSELYGKKLNPIVEDINELEVYINNNYGKIDITMGELIPGGAVSISLNIIPASETKDFITIITSGMSDLPMGTSENDYAEFVIRLPKTWPVSQKDWENDSFSWPAKWLKKIGYFFHEYDEVIYEGMILPNGHEPQSATPFDETTGLSCFLLVNDNPKEKFTDENDDIVNIYRMIPIYKEEYIIAEQKGYLYLLEKLEEKNMNYIFDLNRENLGL
jgi:uncharacterized protein